MKIALVNPPWSFDGSIYFGCREPHLPLEFDYARALLAEAGHGAEIFDAQAEAIDDAALAARVGNFAPDVIVVTTAPTYLFWRCAPPELRVPQELCRLLRQLPAKLVVVGPHGSTTPGAALKKLDADIVILGECEEILPQLAGNFSNVTSIAVREGENVIVRGPNCASDMKRLPALRWPDSTIAKHKHHHHRFDAEPIGPGAEMEASRGCPYHCTFCAKDN